ncbi:MAG TPA: ThuA domain-containing protein [Phycisphaerales bacterium]|nr:ThuA domain-containing protein [Phycisphaerales bacterium]HMP35941.1 ThuA domain-containing protein [Phycisphaerales bacterium]
MRCRHHAVTGALIAALLASAIAGGAAPSVQAGAEERGTHEALGMCPAGATATADAPASTGSVPAPGASPRLNEPAPPKEAGAAPAGGAPSTPSWRAGDDRLPPGLALRPIRVFYCTHSAGYRHECLPLTRRIVEQLGIDVPWLVTTVSDDIAELTPNLLSGPDGIDVLMLYTSGTLPMTDAQKEALKQFITDGGGLVGVHSASDTFHDWPWFIQTLGGEFDGHPWNELVGINVNVTDHPATWDLGRRFEIADEIYQFKNLSDDMLTLLSLDTESVTHGLVPGRRYPLAWTLRRGGGANLGRVFYTALGHRDEVWRDQRFINHLMGGVLWASGRLDAAPTAEPPTAGGATDLFAPEPVPDPAGPEPNPPE